MQWICLKGKKWTDYKYPLWVVHWLAVLARLVQARTVLARWISLCLRQGRLSGSHFGVLGPEPLVRQTAPEPRVRRKRIKYFSHFGVLMLQTRPGGWGGSSEVLPPK